MKRTRLLLIPLLFGALSPAMVRSDTTAVVPAIVGGDRRITLNVPKGDIREALRLVAEQGGLNISIGPGVEGEVSVFLTDATLDGALKSIAVDNGYSYKVDHGIISVSRPPEAKDGEATPPLAVQVFTLRCQDAERVRDALEFALTRYGKMKVLNENSVNEYMTQNLGQLAGDFEGANAANNVNRFGGMQNQNQNQNMLNVQAGVNGQGMIGTPRNARRLVVTDVPENLRRIADLVADLDQLPPQVFIEARIVEMSTDLQRQLGIDWDINALANGPILNHELPLQWEAGFASGSAIRRSANGNAASSAGLSLGTVDLSQVTSLLRIHQTDNAIRLLANPRLLVFNNHSASILVGERYPILTANITDFGTVTESFDTYIPVGVQLEVTPTIMLDGRISLLVHPVTSALGDDVVGTTGLRVARIRTRELSTRVVMNDGQTIALGGLISDRNTRQVSKVPGLGDLWGLSAIFRQERPRSERIDLVCFLTARCEGAEIMTERDREVFGMYEPHFKQIQKSQDVQLHFEVPSEYDAPKPMFGDPPAEPVYHEEWNDPPPAAPTPPNPVDSTTVIKAAQSRDIVGDIDSGVGAFDAPLAVEKSRQDLIHSREVRDRRALHHSTNRGKASGGEKSARDRILTARERGGLSRRAENDRRAENQFDRSAAKQRSPARQRVGAAPSQGYGVDPLGRPVALGRDDEN